MRIADRDVDELRRYLARIVELLPRLPLDAQVGGGAGVGQLAYHAAESADEWIRLRLLGDQRPRDRDAEFTGQRRQEEVAAALDRALAACDELVRRAPELDAVSPSPPPFAPAWTVLNCFVHVTSHTAEHIGHLESSLT